MEAKDAVRTAKRYVNELFSDTGEDIFNLGLEEIEHDSSRGIWSVTLGFSRPWQRDVFGDVAAGSGARDYRVVEIDANGRVASLRMLEGVS